MSESPSPLLSLAIQYLAPVLFSALAAVLTWGLAQLARKWGADAQGSRAAAVGAWAAELASSVVHELEATLRAELKAATADGVLTPGEVERLRNAALNRLKALAGERGLAALQSGLGIAAPELDSYLRGLLERAVAGLPATNPPNP